jgi:SesB domain on fungal death-pathway protein
VGVSAKLKDRVKSDNTNLLVHNSQTGFEPVTDLVNDLVDLFPAAQASQRELCEIEVSEISTDESLPVLKDIAAGQDGYLEAAILKVIQNRKVHSLNATFSGSNNSGFQLGHNAGKISGFTYGGSG